MPHLKKVALPIALVQRAAENNIDLKKMLTLLSDVLNLSSVDPFDIFITSEMYLPKQYKEETRVEYFVRLLRMSSFSQGYMDDVYTATDMFSDISRSQDFHSLVQKAILSTSHSMLESYTPKGRFSLPSLEYFQPRLTETKNEIQLCRHDAINFKALELIAQPLEPPELFISSCNLPLLRDLFSRYGSVTISILGLDDISLFVDFRGCTKASFSPIIFPVLGLKSSDFCFLAYTNRITPHSTSSEYKDGAVANPHDFKEPFYGNYRKIKA